jgi:hypothetical protein
MEYGVMRDIEIIQQHRGPDYPDFRDRVTKSTLNYIRSMAKNGDNMQLMAVLNEDWLKLYNKIMSTDKIAISVSQRDASLLISEMRIREP